MKCDNVGVLQNSNIYFYTKSESAQKLFMYPLCVGHYFCDASYMVERQSYNSFLLLYIVSGSGFVRTDVGEEKLYAGSLLIIDCYAPHCYGATTGWETLWVHFDGASARKYFEAISQGRSYAAIALPNPYAAKRDIERIYNMFHTKGQPNEALCNKYLTCLLTEFLTSNVSAQEKNTAIPDELLAYITENLQDNLTLERLAKRVSLSTFYFTRQFKKETGYTPHEYLITARINAASYYLKTSAMPIKEIAFKCGFTSESGFCTAFKKERNFTPTEYRKAQK